MRKFLIVLSKILIISSLFFCLVGGLAFIFVRSRVDFRLDEELFSSSHTTSVISLYVDGSGKYEGKLDAYEPVLREEVCLTDLKNKWASLDEIPKLLQKTFVAVEDREYYNHMGVNLRRTLMALTNRITGKKPTFGASTITQQVIKNLSGDNEITATRKMCEIVRAIRLESAHTKEEILEMYLNIIPLGDQTAGIKMAAKEFFSKEPKDLSVGEIALLVGMANAPSRYHPRLHPEAAKEKRRVVLSVMVREGLISKEEGEKADDEPIVLRKDETAQERIYSWYTEATLNEVISDLMEERELSRTAAEILLTRCGARIYTAEEPEVTRAIDDRFTDYKNLPYAAQNGLSYSMIVMSNKNGNIAGVLGASGKKTANRLYNKATDAKLTPGSALKPIALYANLIDQGKITSSTVFDDTPAEWIEGGTHKLYPKNAPKVYDGLITVREALVKSKNTVAVKMYDILGAEEIYDTLVNGYEITSLVRHSHRGDGTLVSDLAPSPLALGQLSYGVTLRELTRAYTAFPNEGVMGMAKTYFAVYDQNGDILLKNETAGKRVLKKESANLMCDLLSDVTDRGTAREIHLSDLVDTAGKTGTSGDDLDRLFIGFTPYYTAGIWCGYDDKSTPVGRQAPTHLALWESVMRDIHNRMDEHPIRTFSKEGLVLCEYCDCSGDKPSGICSLDPRGNRIHTDYFIKGQTPRKACETHVPVLYDTVTGAVATRYCPAQAVKLIALLKMPSRRYRENVIISDAEYMTYDMDETATRGDRYDAPYFIYVLPEEEKVGRSKGKKQFNSGCYLHDENYSEN